MRTLLLNRLAVFVTVALLSGLLLLLYPFYPVYILIALALAMGVVSLESANIALVAAILLAVPGALYQSAWIGVTFLIVFLFTLTLVLHWVDVVCVVATWILAFLTPVPSLAIAPTLFAGMHGDRKDALGVGLASGVSVFLLAWTRGLMQAGLMLVPSPSGYAMKAVPNPWQFAAAIPNAGVFSVANLMNYYGPLISSQGDIRVYALIATWAIAGYLTSVLASKVKGNGHYASSLVGVVPAVIVSFVFAQASPLALVVALIAGVVIAPVYDPRAIRGEIEPS